MRSLQLWVEVQEINDYGQYGAVTILQRDDVEVGGVVQLKQGQQRRIVVRIKQLANSGNLPVTIDSVQSVR